MRTQTKTNIERYNYSHFRGNQDALEFQALALGEQFPDFTLTCLDGRKKNFHDIVNGRAVVICGSLSCPLFIDNIPKITELTETFAGVKFIILYVREAHPGSKLSAHKSMDQKIDCANRLQSKFPKLQNIFVDSLDGAGHEYLGNQPNACMVLDSNKTVTYRSNWLKTTDLHILFSGLILRRDDCNLDGVTCPTLPSPKACLDTFTEAGLDSIFDLARSMPRVLNNYAKLKKHTSNSDHGHLDYH